MNSKKMYPVCSVWIGHYPNSEPEYEEDEWTDEKTGEKHKSKYRVDEDVNLSTDSFPNNGLRMAFNCLKDGYGVDDIEWENSGGGASSAMLETDFQVAQWIIDLKLEFTDEDIDELDEIIWEDENAKDTLLPKKTMIEKDWFDMAITFCDKKPKLAQKLLKVGKIKNKEYIKTIMDKITLNAIAGTPD